MSGEAVCSGERLDFGVWGILTMKFCEIVGSRKGRTSPLGERCGLSPDRGRSIVAPLEGNTLRVDSTEEKIQIAVSCFPSHRRDLAARFLQHRQ